MDFELHGQGVGERRERERTVLSLLPVQTSPTTENHFGPSPTAFYGSIGTFSLPFSSPFSRLFFSTSSTSTFFFLLFLCNATFFRKKLFYFGSHLPSLCPGPQGHHKTRIQWEDCHQSCNIASHTIQYLSGHHHQHCGPLDSPHRPTNASLGVFSWRSSFI